MFHEFLQKDKSWFNNFMLAPNDSPPFIRELEDEAQGIGLSPDIMPQQTCWLLKDRRTILGEIGLRPISTPHFEQ
jgi:hypothetical protein